MGTIVSVVRAFLVHNVVSSEAIGTGTSIYHYALPAVFVARASTRVLARGVRWIVGLSAATAYVRL